MNPVTLLDSRTARVHGPEREANRRFCGVDEFAQICGISRSHAYELVARREIPALRLGRRVLIPLSLLDDLDGGCDDEST
jgi:excisionase family DNA binding protein